MKFRLLEKVSFRESTRTMWFNLIKAHPRMRLADEEVVVFLSQSLDNLRFVYGVMELDDGSLVLRSRELRMLKGEWDLLKLKSYAAKAGMRISDWSVFEKALKQTTEKLVKEARQALKSAL